MPAAFFEKFRGISQASRIPEQAVQPDVSLPGVFFLRIAAEANTPVLLNLRRHLAQGKVFLIKSLQQHPGFDAEAFKFVRDFLLPLTT